MQLITQQYELVKSARGALFAYCDTLAPAHFSTPLAGFGSGSIRQLLVHVANTYQFWLGNFALRQAKPFLPAEAVLEVAHARQLFEGVNGLVDEFSRHVRTDWNCAVTGTVASQPAPVRATPLELFTHVTTHEFHHKGQILSMSRQLGYQPVDTDVIRFS